MSGDDNLARDYLGDLVAGRFGLSPAFANGSGPSSPIAPDETADPALQIAIAMSLESAQDVDVNGQASAFLPRCSLSRVACMRQK